MESFLDTTGRVVRGAVAGMVAGAVASWVMNQYIEAQRQSAPSGRGRSSCSGPQDAALPEPQQAKQPEEDATVKTAQAISTRVFEHKLTPAEKNIAGPAVHYAFGTVVGGLYGSLAEVWSLTSAGFGMFYGMALWALGDETAVPALRLGPPPHQVPARKHADFLGAHLVYGLALDFCRRIAKILI